MTLHIIGNGFDLCHGIASRYTDFKDYAWKHGNQYYIGLLETCYPDVNPQSDNNELYLWCDLERALGNPNFQSAFDAITDDIEMEEGHEGRYQAQMEDAPEYYLDMMFGEFHSVFGDWVNHIDIKVEPLRNLEHFERKGLFLSFNYTETLEQLYRVSRENINYIHGRRNSTDELIVGHCNTLSGMQQLSDDPMVYEYAGYDNIAKVVNEERKSVSEIISLNENYWKSLSMVNKVIVYGHSMSDVDMPYFHKIAENVVNDSEWHFSIHYNNPLDCKKAVAHVKNVIKELDLDINLCHTFEM